MNNPAFLIGAGMLGHTWVVTAKGEAGEVIRAQCSCGEDAARIFREYADAVALYTRKGKGWKRVSVGYAAACGRRA